MILDVGWLDCGLWGFFFLCDLILVGRPKAWVGFKEEVFCGQA